MITVFMSQPQRRKNAFPPTPNFVPTLLIHRSKIFQILFNSIFDFVFLLALEIYLDEIHPILSTMKRINNSYSAF